VIDTHAHLYLEEFDDDRDHVMQRARDAGVKKIYLPNIDLETIDSMRSMIGRYPGQCLPMIGLHPCSVKEDYLSVLDAIHTEAAQHTYAAIGEIGTDLFWDQTFKKEQEVCFRDQLALAKALGLPVAIHSRETLDWNIQIVKENMDAKLRGVFHCFTGTVEQARQIIEMGFYLGIGGVLTFKNSGLAEVVAQLPMESLVLETDAPFLTPHPYRGKRNESGYLGLVAQKLAECHGRTLDEVARVTTANAEKLFKRGE